MKKIIILFLMFAFNISEGQITLRSLGQGILNAATKSAYEDPYERKRKEAQKAVEQEVIKERQATEKRKYDEDLRVAKYHNSYSFEKVEGPYGGDARVLMKDSNNSLWLGTGGTGAVYQFDDNAQRWIQKSKNYENHTVTRISEIEGVVFAKFTSRKSDNEYASEYKEFILRLDKEDKLSEQQFTYVNSEMAADWKKRKETVYEALEKNEKFRTLQLETDTFNDLTFINNQFFILDTRGLFYIDEIKKKIEKFNEIGINSLTISQIIPHKDNIYVWAQNTTLWKKDQNTWTDVFHLSYHTPEQRLRYATEILTNDSKRFTEHKATSYITISENDLVAVTRRYAGITGSLNDAKKMRLQVKELSGALFDNQDNLFFISEYNLYKKDNEGNVKLIRSVRDFNRFRDVNYSFTFGGVVLKTDNIGKAYVGDEPLFLKLDDSSPRMSPKYTSTLSVNYTPFLYKKDLSNLLVFNRDKGGRVNHSEYFAFEIANARTEQDLDDNMLKGDERDYHNRLLSKYEIKYDGTSSFLSVFSEKPNSYLIGTDGSGLLRLTLK